MLKPAENSALAAAIANDRSRLRRQMQRPVCTTRSGATQGSLSVYSYRIVSMHAENKVPNSPLVQLPYVANPKI